VNATITVDKSGRIVLPKSVRDELRLSAGDPLDLEIDNDQIILRPARPKRRLYKKKGIWVLETGTPLSTDVVAETLRRVRQEREDRIIGKHQ
jgi:AbrB family looped-hinge helix DNA binding protein